MEEKIKSKTHGSDAVKIRLIFIVLGVLLLLPPIVSPVTASDPPLNEEKECLAFGYSNSDRHYFLIEDYSLVFGNNITFEHNCENLEVKINGNTSAFDSTGKFTLRIETGFHNISISNNENFSRNYSFVQILPDRLNWEFEYYEWESRDSIAIDELISIVTAESRENWASILSIVMVFSLVTMVYWNLINSYIDRNYCEEVIR